jgi:CRISPR system Cascade subunit CasE
MIYLSRLILDTRHRQARRDLGDCHQIHRTVLRAFPPAPEGTVARERFGLLYRVEPIEGATALFRLLVQSNTAPNWSHLPSGYLGPASDDRGNPALRVVSDEYAQIAAGARLVFRLRANPTKRISDRTPGRENTLLGKRVALLSEDEQVAWLVRKGQAHGFQPLATAARPELPDVRAGAQGQRVACQPERRTKTACRDCARIGRRPGNRFG